MNGIVSDCLNDVVRGCLPAVALMIATCAVVAGDVVVDVVETKVNREKF